MGRRPHCISPWCCVHGQVPHCPHAPWALCLGPTLALQAGKLRHGAPGPISSVGTTAAGPLMVLSAPKVSTDTGSEAGGGR